MSARIVRQVVDYSNPDAPVPMQANALFEVDYKKWVLSRVREQGHYPKDDAVYGGSAAVGCSPLTATRYLRQLLSSVGPLQETKDMLGGWMLTWKDGMKPEPAIKIDPDDNSTRERESGTKEPRLFP